MTLDRQGQLVRGHAVTVVGDQDPGQAAAVRLDLDTLRPGVERILDQFLDGAGRTFDHLAGGDAVDGFGGETTDGHGIREDRPLSGAGRGENADAPWPPVAFVIPGRARRKPGETPGPGGARQRGTVWHDAADRFRDR